MSHHRTPPRKLTALPSLIALAAILVAAALGLAACGGSSSTTTTTETTANAAATGTTTTGTSSTGTTSTGTSSTATTPGASTTGASPTGTTPAARAARFAAVRTCLSKKGITLPQGGAGGFPGAGGGAQLPSGMSRAQFAEALQSCGVGFKGSNHFGRGAGGFKNPYNNPRFHPVLVRLSACLRQNGINVGEPNTSGKGPIFDTKGLNTGSKKFKTAMANCRYTLLGALKSKAHPGATG